MSVAPKSPLVLYVDDERPNRTAPTSSNPKKCLGRALDSDLKRRGTDERDSREEDERER